MSAISRDIEGWDIGIGGPRRGLGVIPKFYTRQRVDAEATIRENRPVYRTQEMVELFMPGEVEQSVSRAVDDEIRAEYRKQYDFWKKGQEEVFVDGMPLSEWPAISREQVESLRYFKVYSVEQLAELSDTQTMGMGMGMTALRNKARDWLRVASDNAAAVNMARVARESEERAAHLEAQVNQMQIEMERLQALLNAALRHGGVTPNDDQLSEVSMIGAPKGAMPDPDVVRYLIEQQGLKVPSPPPASTPAPQAKAAPKAPAVLPKRETPLEVQEGDS